MKSLSMGKNLRIEDIAAACGVSAATVSNVLNNRANTASAETRERVLATVRELNYRPRALASGARARSSNTIGVVLVQSRLSDSAGLSYLNGFVEGILPAALEQSYFVTLYGNFSWPDMREALRVYCDGRCDGMLLIAPPAQTEEVAIIQALRERGIPFVCVTGMDSESPLPCVDIDNAQAARDMVAHLVHLGHRQITYFGGSDNLVTSQERERGFRQGMEDAGLAIEPGSIYHGQYGYESGHERAEQLCRDTAAGRIPCPTAIFCANDSSAFGAIAALQARGLKVPDDISVAGFDDIPAAAQHDPPLTTMRQPLAEMGAEAVRLLLSILPANAANSAGAAHSPEALTLRASASRPQAIAPAILLHATLAARASTAPPRQSRRRCICCCR